jgi:hypothetical protein
MPTPTHSGSRPRIGLACSAVLATDIVIGAAGSFELSRPIEARQGIILGKSRPLKVATNARESRVLAISVPGDCNNRGA